MYIASPVVLTLSMQRILHKEVLYRTVDAKILRFREPYFVSRRRRLPMFSTDILYPFFTRFDKATNTGRSIFIRALPLRCSSRIDQLAHTQVEHLDHD